MNHSHEPSHLGDILIVDDNPDELRTLEKMLGDQGYQVRCVLTGSLALKVVRAAPIGIVLLDVDLNDASLDGYQICQRLKNDIETRHLPVIFITGKKTEIADKIKAFDAGGVDYIIKPFDRNKVLEVVARVETHLKLANIDRERKELMQVLCHDLCNLLMVLPFYLARIKPNDDESKLAIRHIKVASSRSIGVVKAFNQMQRLGSQDLEMRCEATLLREVLEESRNILEPKLTEKKIDLKMNVGEKLRVSVDRAFFGVSVINNVLTNAIKFSEMNSEIDITAEAVEDHVVVRIRDHGIGIPSVIIDDLFDIHKRTSRNGTAGEGGTGYGLPLVKKFVTAMGGRVEVSSKEVSANPRDHGTEVRLTLKSCL